MPKRLIQHAGPRIMVNRKFLQGIVLYNVLVYALVILAYHVIDFDAHFKNVVADPDAPPKPTTTGEIMYYAFLVHATVMAGEYIPTTKLGRGILAVHVLLSWGLIMILMAPWSAL
jgi:hypothetical protein